MMSKLWRDIRYAVRTLRRTPGFTVVAVATLAIGIGANAAIFSVVNAVLLEPLPFPDADRLVGIWHTAPGLGYDQIPLSGDTYAQIREYNSVFEDVAVVNGGTATLTEDGEPERVDALGVTHTLLPVLGVEPALGRNFTAEEDMPEAPDVALLSHGLWQRRYGGDPGLVGRTIQVDGSPVEVVGVLPEGFQFMQSDAEVFVPLGIDPANPPVGSFSVNGIGRLVEGRTAEVAEANLAPLVDRLLEANRESENYVAFLENGQFGTLVNPLKEDVVGEVRQPLLILLGTVAFVLLIACANVANLVIVRSDARRREMAVRSALGAGRGVLSRQFLAESAALALAGGVIGVALAAAAVPALLSVAPDGLPRAAAVGVDATVLAFSAGLVLVSVVLFGVLPMIRSFSSTAFGALTSARGATAGRDRHRLRNLLVAGQTALALILLVGSGLMLRSFDALRSVDPGFEAEGSLVFRLSLPPTTYETAQSAASFHQQLMERIATLPGVESVGAVDYVPLTGNGSGTAHRIEDKPVGPGDLPPMLWYKYAAPGYFETMRIGLVAGRTLERADHEQQLPNVVVSKHLAERIWPGEDALGKRVSFASSDTVLAWYSVVGVVDDVRDQGLNEDVRDLVYYPMVGANGDEDWRSLDMTYVVRTAGPPTSLAGPLRAQVWEMDPNLPVADMRPMADILAESTARTSFTMMALAVAALVALLLGAIGLYGVVSYVVSERTREIGVRMALGAEKSEVQRMVVTQGVKLALMGLVVGLVASLALTRLLGSLLFGTSPTDPVTFATTSLVLLAVGTLASYLPARRASTIDPVASLRSE
jgi:predicted permease